MADQIGDLDEPSCPQCADANERAEYAVAEQQATLQRLYDLEAAQDLIRQRAKQFENLMATLDRAGGALMITRQPDGSILVSRPV